MAGGGWWVPNRPGMNPRATHTKPLWGLSPNGDTTRIAGFAGTGPTHCVRGTGEVFDCKGSIFFNTFQKQRGTTCLTTFKSAQTYRPETDEAPKLSRMEAAVATVGRCPFIYYSELRK